MLSRPQEMSGRSRRSDGTDLLRSRAMASICNGERGVAPALLERAAAGEHLGEDHPQRIDVRSPIHLADQGGRAADQGAEVLGGHVRHGSADRGVCGVFVLCRREVEIQQQRLPLGADEDVGRLDVAVQNAPLVRVVQPVGELSHDPCGRALVAQLAQSRRRGHLFVLNRFDRVAAGPPETLLRRSVFVLLLNVEGLGASTDSRASTSCLPETGRDDSVQSFVRTAERLAPPR